MTMHFVVRLLLALTLLSLYPAASASAGFLDEFAGGLIGAFGSRPQNPYYQYPAPQNYYPPMRRPGYGYDYGPPDAVGYCMRRFRSYNPQTGFFVGFDGRLHRCP